MKVSVTFHNRTESWRGGVEKGFVKSVEKESSLKEVAVDCILKYHALLNHAQLNKECSWQWHGLNGQIQLFFLMYFIMTYLLGCCRSTWNTLTRNVSFS